MTKNIYKIIFIIYNIMDIIVNKSKKKSKKCNFCKTKKSFLYKTCDYCFNICCIKCSCPFIHSCEHLDKFREIQKNILKNKLLSSDSNFNKIDKI